MVRIQHLAVTAGLVAVTSVHGGALVHVDDDAPPGGDGASWRTAFRFLQDGLTAASGGGVSEVRVAQGLYLPDRCEAVPDGTGDQEATFGLLNGVAIIGGFAGLGAPDPDDRDPEGYPTTLSGDLAGDDGPDFANNGENSLHVATADGTDGTARLDGFRLTAGSDNPGGLRCLSASPRVDKCVFFDNRQRGLGSDPESHPIVADCAFADNGGGGVGSWGISLSRCTFTNNVAWRGGAVSNYGPLDLVDCVFIGNSAVYTGLDGWGGAVHNRKPSYEPQPVLILGCRFVNNTAHARGGAIFIWSCNLTMVNTLVQANAAEHGGGVAAWAGSETLVFNSTFTENTGSGITYDSSTGSIVNSIFWDNLPEQIHQDVPHVLDVTFCDVQGGWPDGTNIDTDPLFVDGGEGDAILSMASPCIDIGLCDSLPPDVHDLDGDGDTSEPLPVDLDGNTRVADGGLDLGASEYQGPFSPPGDLDGDSLVGTNDLLLLLGGWGSCCTGDVNNDGVIDDEDFDLIVAALGPCPPAGQCAADVDGNGVVDPIDGLLVLENPGLCNTCPPGDPGQTSLLVRPCRADINGDGIVSTADLLSLLGNWG